MAKITAFSRILNHGVSDPLSGATIPTSNDHTDGSWGITDIYDREMMINTGSGLLQYRAGNTIYNVASTTGSTSATTRVVRVNNFSNAGQLNLAVFDITGWDMTDLTPPNDIFLIPTSFSATQIFGLSVRIFNDGNPYLINYNYDYGLSQGYAGKLDVYFDSGDIVIVNNVATYFADPLNDFSGVASNRGIASVLYKS